MDRIRLYGRADYRRDYSIAADSPQCVNCRFWRVRSGKCYLFSNFPRCQHGSGTCLRFEVCPEDQITF